MSNNLNINELHTILDESRRLERLSYQRIASHIGYSGEGVNKALKNKTLSAIQIESIVKEFNLGKYFNNFNNPSNKVGLDKTVKQKAFEVVEGWKEYRSVAVFRAKIDQEILIKLARFRSGAEDEQEWMDSL